VGEKGRREEGGTLMQGTRVATRRRVSPGEVEEGGGKTAGSSADGESRAANALPSKKQLEQSKRGSRDEDESEHQGEARGQAVKAARTEG
jgi:hypothetical protein